MNTALYIFKYFYPIFFTCVLTQFIKFFIEFFKNKKFNFRYLISTGGMPSSHSAIVCSLLTTLILNSADSMLLAACVTFSLIVMYDAANIRRSAGDHAILLNKLNKAIESKDNLKLNEVELKEVLGHTPLEVLIGSLVGIINSVIMNYAFR